jgi:hypothetical protein
MQDQDFLPAGPDDLSRWPQGRAWSPTATLDYCINDDLHYCHVCGPNEEEEDGHVLPSETHNISHAALQKGASTTLCFMGERVPQGLPPSNLLVSTYGGKAKFGCDVHKIGTKSIPSGTAMRMLLFLMSHHSESRSSPR